jgi:hypothetical protein
MTQVHSGVVNKLYKSVIDDVIACTRDIFLDEGIDEQVLVELRALWEQKLSQTKAVIEERPEPEPKSDTKPTKASKAETKAAAAGTASATAASRTSVQPSARPAMQEMKSEPVAPLPPPTPQLVPVQINIPTNPNDPHGSVRTITVQVSLVTVSLEL